MEYKHIAVMLNEAMEILKPGPGQNFIDCTLGGGGVSLALARKILPGGKVLAIDLDELAVENFRFSIFDFRLKNIITHLGNFKNLQQIVEKYFPLDFKFNGIVFDLGLSSAQLKDRLRGFSFNLPGAPLGMNFGEQIRERAVDIVNNWSLEALAEIFKNYGEEKLAYKIAIAIAKERQVKRIITTDQLVKVILGAMPASHRRKKIHPATKIFQALRLAVNQELDNLSRALPQALNLLRVGGKLIVISYHSLEDRAVKQYFKQESRDCLCPPETPLCQCGHQARLKVLTRKVLRPTEQEVLNNPRARSAKLRAAEKIK